LTAEWVIFYLFGQFILQLARDKTIDHMVRSAGYVPCFDIKKETARILLPQTLSDFKTSFLKLLYTSCFRIYIKGASSY